MSKIQLLLKDLSNHFGRCFSTAAIQMQFSIYLRVWFIKIACSTRMMQGPIPNILWFSDGACELGGILAG